MPIKLNNIGNGNIVPKEHLIFIIFLAKQKKKKNDENEVWVLTYRDLIVNRYDSNHHNYNSKVEAVVHIKAEFHQFREER